MYRKITKLVQRILIYPQLDSQMLTFTTFVLSSLIYTHKYNFSELFQLVADIVAFYP